MKPGCFRFLCFFLFSVATGFAQGSLDLQPNDSMRDVLQRQVGQAIELRLQSGEKIGGKLEKVNEKLAHLAQLTGAEYFEAAVSLDKIAAVVVRLKK